MKVGDRIEGTVVEIMPNVAPALLPGVTAIARIVINGCSVHVPLPEVVTHVNPDDSAMRITHSVEDTCHLCAIEALK